MENIKKIIIRVLMGGSCICHTGSLKYITRVFIIGLVDVWIPFLINGSLLTTKGIDSKEILTGIIPKLYRIQGTSIINAMTIGNSTVQQNDISWSYLIRGKEALAQIKINIIIQALSPITIPPIIVPNVVL